MTDRQAQGTQPRLPYETRKNLANVHDWLRLTRPSKKNSTDKTGH